MKTGNRVKENKIHLNLPPNYKKCVFFDQLPYSAHLKNPTIQGVVNNGINNKKTFQKYLLATSILESFIQDSLDKIVSDDGKLSDAAVHRQLDLKIPSVMKKTKPINYVFKDIAKFDT